MELDVDKLRTPVLLFDAAGLALFAVAGAQKALAFGLNPVMAALLGMLTGIGGGMVRDVLLAEIPTVLRADLYAVAALAAAAVVVIGHMPNCRRARARSWVRPCASAFASWRFVTAGACPVARGNGKRQTERYPGVEPTRGAGFRGNKVRIER